MNITDGKPQTLIFLMLLLSHFSTWASGEQIEVTVGHTVVMPENGIKRVAVGNGELLDVKVLNHGQQVLLIGKSQGQTDLRIWLKNGSRNDYRVKVAALSAADTYDAVLQHIGDIEGVQARLVGDRIILEGSSVREQDYARLEKIEKQFPIVVNYVKPGAVTMRGMIMMDVKVVEIRRNALKTIGVNWDNQISGPQYANVSDIKTNSLYRPNSAPGGTSLPLDAGKNNPYFGISTSFTSVINLLSQDGLARTLAEPRLTCRSGGKAEFLAGGEVPIPIVNNDGSVDVEFKDYGIILEMEPVADNQGYISTVINVEVSDIDESVTVLSVPGFLTRKTKTEMNVKEGETMVISGLYNSDASKDVDKVPGVSRIPILGELFKSRTFRNDETELMIFVTPYLVDPNHRINKEMLNKAHKLREDSDKNLRFSLKD